MRVCQSFVSVEKARRNVDTDIPDGTTLEQTAKTTRAACGRHWAEKRDQVQIQGRSPTREQLETIAVPHLTGFRPFGFAVWRIVDILDRDSLPVPQDEESVPLGIR